LPVNSTGGTVLPAGVLQLATLLVSCAGAPGMAAYRQGNYGGALREFRASDEPAGEFAVGVMEYKGEGVARDPSPGAVGRERPDAAERFVSLCVGTPALR
jgi:hypothetical protein